METILIPRRILTKRYDRSTRTIQRRRQLCGHITSHRDQMLPLREVEDLDDWHAACSSWGLAWSGRQFLEFVIEKRLYDPSYNLDRFLQDRYSCRWNNVREILASQGVEPLEHFFNQTIDVNFEVIQ